MDSVTNYLSAVTPNKWERNCRNLEERAEVQSWEGSQQTQKLEGANRRWGREGERASKAQLGAGNTRGAGSDSLCGPTTRALGSSSVAPPTHELQPGVSQSYALTGSRGWGSRWDW